MSPPYRGAWFPRLYTPSTNGMLAVWAVSVEVSGPQETPRILIETSFEEVQTGKIQGEPIRITLRIKSQTGVDPFWRAHHEAQDLWNRKLDSDYTQFRGIALSNANRFRQGPPKPSKPIRPPKLTMGFRREGTLAQLLGKRKDQG